MQLQVLIDVFSGLGCLRRSTDGVISNPRYRRNLASFLFQTANKFCQLSLVALVLLHRSKVLTLQELQASSLGQYLIGT